MALKEFLETTDAGLTGIRQKNTTPLRAEQTTFGVNSVIILFRKKRVVDAF